MIFASIVVLVTLFALSFVFNFVWESFHAVYLYKGHDFDASRYIPMLVYVSIIDGLLINGIYLAVSAMWKNLIWIRHFKKAQIFVFLTFGLLLAAAIEYRAIYVTHRWSYKESMPTVFGLGLSPLLQLSLTGLVAVWLAGELLFGEGLLRKAKKRTY